MSIMKTRAQDINEKITWQEVTTGAEIYEPATSLLVETGDWRVMMPVFKEDKCKHCMLCVPFCPDSENLPSFRYGSTASAISLTAFGKSVIRSSQMRSSLPGSCTGKISRSSPALFCHLENALALPPA